MDNIRRELAAAGQQKLSSLHFQLSHKDHLSEIVECIQSQPLRRTTVYVRWQS
jgi:hypothetical protein